MSDWIERLRPAVLNTPDGKIYNFEYGDLSKNVNFKTNKFTFGDKEGSLVQNFGLGEVGIPLQVIFSGSNHDQVADELEASLAIVGSSLLEHPRYGNIDVVIEGYIRSDPVKSAGNQTIFDMAITQTIIPAAPVSTTENRSAIISFEDDFINDSSEVFQPNYDSLADQASSKNRILAGVASISDAMQSIIQDTQEVNDSFNDAEDFINDNIDELLDDPPILAASIQSMIRFPSRSTTNATSKISAFLTSMSAFQIPIAGYGADILNQRLETQLFTTALLMGAAESSLFVNGDFIKKSDAIEAANNILSGYRDLQEYLDNQEVNALTDSLNLRYSVSDIIAAGIKNITSLTAGQLVQLSFSLKQERIIILGNDETLIPLTHRLYGGKIDDPLAEYIDITKIDFLIQTNELTADEIILIPAGREIKYYI